ncbi:MAG: ankyrin repeat domain-containing protein [Bacteroidota bacterium]
MGGDWKAMFYACEKGDLPLVEYYIKEGIDPNYQHPEFLTSPLIETVRGGHVEVAEFLLKNGADPHVKAVWGGETALDVAKIYRHKKLVKLLQAYQ